LTKCQVIGNAAKTGKSENKHLQLKIPEIATIKPLLQAKNEF
jgi:hypothetical protein